MYTDSKLKSCDNCDGSGFIKNESHKELREKIKHITDKATLEKVSPFNTCDKCFGTGKDNYTKVLDNVCCRK